MRSCPACTAPNDAAALYCFNCGATLPVIPLGSTVYQPSGTSAAAIASLILGLFFFIFPAAVAAVILGHISHSQIRKSAGRLTGDRMSLAGTILGYAGICLFPIILIASIAFLSYRFAPSVKPANESAAIRNLRTIADASLQYSSRYKVYPPSLAALGPPQRGQKPSVEAANLLDAGLATGEKDGYVFSYAPLSSRRNGRFDGYNAEADPIYALATGAKHFHVDESGIVREELRGAAGRQSPLLH